MAPKRSRLEKKAFKMWCTAGRPRGTKWIADELGIKPEMVRKWKHYYKWEEQDDPRPGAPRGNKNAKGNKGGAPPGNANAVKHGMFRKFMPQDEEFLAVYDLAAEAEPLDMLWQSIVMKFTSIIRAPAIMHVTGKTEMIKELKKRKYEIVPNKTKKGYTQAVTEEEYEFQWAWDRYATYLKAQSVAMAELRSMIKQFLSAAPEDDERRAKLELMQAQLDKTRAEVEKVRADTEKTRGGGKNSEVEDWVTALKQVTERRRAANQQRETHESP